MVYLFLVIDDMNICYGLEQRTIRRVGSYVDLGIQTGVTSNTALNFTLITPVMCTGAFVREAMPP